MANIQINNAEMKKAFSDNTKTELLQAVQVIDNSKVIPVLDINPRINRNLNFHKNVTLNNATSANLFTSDSVKTTYIYHAQINFIKDATSTATLIRMLFNDEYGAVQALISIPTLTLTAQTGSASVTLPVPIKIAKNTTISITSDTNVANIRVTGLVHGFFDQEAR